MCFLRERTDSPSPRSQFPAPGGRRSPGLPRPRASSDPAAAGGTKAGAAAAVPPAAPGDPSPNLPPPREPAPAPSPAPCPPGVPQRRLPRSPDGRRHGWAPGAPSGRGAPAGGGGGGTRHDTTRHAGGLGPGPLRGWGSGAGELLCNPLRSPDTPSPPATGQDSEALSDGVGGVGGEPRGSRGQDRPWRAEDEPVLSGGSSPGTVRGWDDGGPGLCPRGTGRRRGRGPAGEPARPRDAPPAPLCAPPPPSRRRLLPGVASPHPGSHGSERSFGG